MEYVGAMELAQGIHRVIKAKAGHHFSGPLAERKKPVNAQFDRSR
jgi:hypothetical protein